jgi:predicted transposase/invertase (TIGR01784 family)
MQKPTPTINTYIDPMTSYGFMRLFGTEANKDFVIDLLNSLFKGKKHIVDATFIANDTEYVFETEERNFYHLRCTDKDNKTFLVELQRGDQRFNMQRAMFSPCIFRSYQEHMKLPVEEREQKELPEVYIVVILEDHTINAKDPDYLKEICIGDVETGANLTEGIGFYFLELDPFNKSEDELESDLDRWMYVIKNLSTLTKLPEALQTPLFSKVLQETKTESLDEDEMNLYDYFFNLKWSTKHYLDRARAEGKKIGMQEGIEEGRKEGKHHGLLQGRIEGQLEGKLDGAVVGLKEGKFEGKLEGIQEERNRHKTFITELVNNLVREGISIGRTAKLVMLTTDEVKQMLSIKQ